MTPVSAPLPPHRYDFVEVEEPSDGSVLGRWCGSGTVPGKQTSKGNHIRIRFVSDEYFPSEPGFCIHYSIIMPVSTTLRFSLFHWVSFFLKKKLISTFIDENQNTKHQILFSNLDYFYHKSCIINVTASLSLLCRLLEIPSALSM